MLVGIVPMGGVGERWSPYPCPKELLPFGVDERGRPLVIADHVIRGMERAGVELIVVPVRAEKATAVLGYFGHRRLSGATMVYLSAPGPSLAANLRACVPVLGNNPVLFGMPDTYFTPEHAFTILLAELENPTEVVLGCWEHDNLAELDTVDRDGRIIRSVQPKPRPVELGLREAWGLAVWSADFTRRLAEWDDPSRPNPGFVFAAAAREGLARGVGFAEGTYIDIGSYGQYEAGLWARRREIADHAATSET
jgi:NDP-sugar pyrophosphorylase family protein